MDQQQSFYDGEARDCLAALVRQEEMFYRCCDAYYCDSPKPQLHLQHDSSSIANSIVKVQSLTSISDVRDVTEEVEHTEPVPNQHHCFFRQQMFDWSLAVLDSFGMDREACSVAFNILDRYLAIETNRGGPSVTRDDYQLYSMVCLYLAVKISEPYPRKLSVQVLVDMSKDYYCKDVIESTERDILESLNWHLHTPTELSYVRLFQQVLMEDDADSMISSASSQHLQATATTLTELAVSDAFFVAYPNSCVGLAALIHAARLEHISEHKIQKLQVLLQDLVDTDTSEFRAVYLQLEKLYCHH